jgi:hypothetical protein
VFVKSPCTVFNPTDDLQSEISVHRFLKLTNSQNMKKIEEKKLLNFSPKISIEQKQKESNIRRRFLRQKALAERRNLTAIIARESDLLQVF